MKDAMLEIDVSYVQIGIFESEMDSPFNDWSQHAVNQGFSWRRGSVFFKTVDNGLHRVSINVVDRLPQPPENCETVILVPFETASGNLEAGSIHSGVQFAIEPGEYCLQFMMFHDEVTPHRIEIYFSKGRCEPAVLVSHSEPVSYFEMDAKPA